MIAKLLTALPPAQRPDWPALEAPTAGPAPAAVGWAKAALDYGLGAALLLLSAPLVLLAAALVKLTSPGPALYSQVRLGRGGRPYRIWKLRTMRHDCEKLSGPRWSARGDPRVTAAGRLLRRTHLDELPQLWNVLRGEMSLVGPRPERPEFVPALEARLPRYRARLAVKPGLTGLAQVQLEADTDLESVRRKLGYDLWYVARAGLGLDGRILAATALKVAGLPFGLIGRLCALPAEAAVERHARGLPPAPAEPPPPPRPLPQAV